MFDDTRISIVKDPVGLFEMWAPVWLIETLIQVLFSAFVAIKSTDIFVDSIKLSPQQIYCHSKWQIITLLFHNGLHLFGSIHDQCVAIRCVMLRYHRVCISSK